MNIGKFQMMLVIYVPLERIVKINVIKRIEGKYYEKEMFGIS